jgi:hypothetical protein
LIATGIERQVERIDQRMNARITGAFARWWGAKERWDTLLVWWFSDSRLGSLIEPREGIP